MNKSKTTSFLLKIDSALKTLKSDNIISVINHFELENYSEIKKSKEFKNEIDSATSSYNFIKTLRFATNILNKRNRLNFETQIDISQKANIKESTNKKIVEKMMQEFYSNASVISDFNNLVFESFIEKNTFSLTKGLGELYTKGNKVGIKKGPLSKRKNLFFEVFYHYFLFKCQCCIRPE